MNGPGCYYGPDVPDGRDCGVCGFCRGRTDGLTRSPMKSLIVREANAAAANDPLREVREHLEIIPPGYDWHGVETPRTLRERVRDLIARLTGRRYR